MPEIQMAEELDPTAKIESTYNNSTVFSRTDSCTVGLLREVSRLRAALTLKTHQAHGLAVVVNNHILNYDYYRDRCRELEDELVRRLGTVDPDALRIVMPLRFPD